MSSSPTSSQLFAKPESADILCGKGKECNDFEGSQHYRLVIDSFRQKYSAALSRRQKMAVTTEIYDLLKSMNRRFLRYNPSLQAWEELSLQAARDKIGHALRFANRSTRGNSKADLPSQETSSSIGAGMEQAGTSQGVNSAVKAAPPAATLPGSRTGQCSATRTATKSRKHAKRSSLTSSQLIRIKVEAKLKQIRQESLLALEQQKLAADGPQHNPAATTNTADDGSIPLQTLPQGQHNELVGIEPFWAPAQYSLDQEQAEKSLPTCTHTDPTIASVHPATQEKAWNPFPYQDQANVDFSVPQGAPAVRQNLTLPLCIGKSSPLALSQAQVGQNMQPLTCMASPGQQLHRCAPNLHLDSCLEPNPLRLPHAMARQENPYSNVDWEDIKDELRKTFHGAATTATPNPLWANHQNPSGWNMWSPTLLDASAAADSRPGGQVNALPDSRRGMHFTGDGCLEEELK